MVSFLEALEKSSKKFGLDGIEIAADCSTLRGYLNSGNYALNWIMSGSFFGGWPLGHVAEIYGDPSTGKSFIIDRAISEALKKPTAGAVLDDTEHAFNKEWARSGLGIDTSRLAYCNSHYWEEHYKLTQAFVAAMKDAKVTDPSILALDSASLLTTEEEEKGGMKKPYLKMAKEIKKFFRLIGYDLAETSVAYLVANHGIAAIGDMSRQITSGGGGGLKFQATVRLELRTPSRLKDASGRYIGVKINVFVEKNRLVSPWRKCQMIIPFFQPISPVSGLVDLLLQYGAIELTKGHTIAYLGVDSKVAANKSDLFKQDQSALDLLAWRPTLLEELDKVDFYKPAPGTPMVSADDDEEGEEE